MRWPEGGGPGEPDFGAAIDEGIGWAKEPPVLTLSRLRDGGVLSVNPDTQAPLNAGAADD